MSVILSCQSKLRRRSAGGQSRQRAGRARENMDRGWAWVLRNQRAPARVGGQPQALIRQQQFIEPTVDSVSHPDDNSGRVRAHRRERRHPQSSVASIDGRLVRARRAWSVTSPAHKWDRLPPPHLRSTQRRHGKDGQPKCRPHRMRRADRPHEPPHRTPAEQSWSTRRGSAESRVDSGAGTAPPRDRWSVPSNDNHHRGSVQVPQVPEDVGCRRPLRGGLSLSRGPPLPS